MGRRLGINLVLFLVLVLAFAGGVWLRLHFVPAPGRINPQAEIDPARPYRLVLWDFERPLGGAGPSYRAELTQVVEAFRERHPNVTVTIELLPWSEEEGERRLAAALKEGAPPDVLATGPLPASDWGPLVVACESYLVAEEKEGYIWPGRVDAPEGSGRVAWPRWLEPLCWAGNEELLTAAGVPAATLQAQGWNWEEFARLAERVQALPGEPALFTSFNLVTLWGELGRDDVPGAAGKPPWTAESVQRAAERAARLWESAAIPRRIGQAGYSALEDFFNGRVALCGPVRPWFFRAAHERTERVRHGNLDPGEARPFPLVLLPSPGSLPGGMRVVQAEQLYVFRQRRYQGDDHTRAAMELARHLTRSSARLAARLDVVPACRAAQQAWVEEWEVGDGSTLVKWLEQGAVPAEGGAAAAEREARLAPLLHRFWEGGLTAAGLAQEYR
ncbi:MAG TPA: carbohydrate ABC transporter substrate-binding protein [Firmicutes bacterium]|nr:carbohydrate ABC transporter substrate-binding protein [Bacillota bacterium]